MFVPNAPTTCHSHWLCDGRTERSINCVPPVLTDTVATLALVDSPSKRMNLGSVLGLGAGMRDILRAGERPEAVWAAVGVRVEVNWMAAGRVLRRPGADGVRSGARVGEVG